MNDKPGYYAILPANVRYDKRICPNARLLYCEITALCNKEGYCWAKNDYFAALYEVSDRSVQNWLSSLKDSGYIRIVLEFLPGTREVSCRKIFLAETVPHLHKPDDKSPKKPPPAPASPPADDSPAVPVSASPAEITNAAASSGVCCPDSPGGENFFTTPLKISSPPGEKIFTHNININNINKATTATSPPTPEKPDAQAAAADDFSKQAQAINADCLKINPQLVFDRDFYPRAARYMAENNLDSRFLAWLYEYCEKKNPRTLTGLFFKIFFADNVSALFRAEQARDPPPSKPPPEPVVCPVCDRILATGEAECPVCHLQTAHFHDEDRLREARAFYALPTERKAAYDQEVDELLNSQLDFKIKIGKIAETMKRYGIHG